MSPDVPDLTRISALLAAFNALDTNATEKRNELLDELQDAVGLEGRMVMERDILKRAEKLLAAQ